MKKRFLGLLLVTMMILVCAGCGAESLPTDQTETVEATPEESTPEPTIEATEIPEKTAEPTPEEVREEIETESETLETTPKETTEPESTETVPEKTTEPESAEIVPEETTETEKTETVEKPKAPSIPDNCYDLGDGVPRYYGVLYVNACGKHLTNEDSCIPSSGPFPYPMYTPIDNGDGTYTMYVAFNHGGWLDGNGVDFDTSQTDACFKGIPGYRMEFYGGDSWTSCVGGYDEGCIHKWIFYPCS